MEVCVYECIIKNIFLLLFSLALSESFSQYVNSKKVIFLSISDGH